MALGSLEALEGASPFFAMGCQGPDIFYHNRRTMPSGLHYGALAHRRKYGSLVAGAAASLAPEDRRPASPVGAYVLGLATHAPIDRAVHPFIIYFAGWAKPTEPSTQRLRGCHPFLERILDVGLLALRLGISPADYGLTARLRPVSGAEAQLIEPWAAALRSAFPTSTLSDSLLEKRIANALADALHFYEVTAPESTLPGGARDNWLLRQSPEEGRYLVSIIYPPRMPEGLDAMNIAGAEWLHPSGDGRSSCASYPQLLDEGTAAAAAAISQVMRFWDGALSQAELATLIGEGGLGLSDAQGGNLPPLLCRPLPLPEAMAAEYAARTARH